MKQKLLSFLFVLIGLLGNRASVLAQDDSFFEIATAEDLVAFSEYVNAGNYGANAVLTADIDMSSVENFTGIGVARNALYSGTFDGQGHKISGMTISYPGKEDVGFFHIAKATLKNFWLDETCLIEGDKGVALVGWCNGDSPVLEGIGVAAQIKGSENTSSFIGRAWKNPQFKNCWSIGEIDNSVGSGNKTNTGVFMGWCNTWGGSFTNCWTTATFAIAPADANYLTRKGDNVTFNNCYSLYGSQAKRMTEDDVTNGALCYALNGDQSEITWYQTIGVDSHPVLDSTHGIVYLAVGIGCNGKAKGDVPFTNTDLGISSEPDPHTIVDGLCSVCGQLPQAEDGFYEIASAAALLKFSEMVNSGMVQINGRLTADIDMSSVENFTPIGLYGDNSPNKLNYYGTFDGARHIISDLTIFTDEWYEAGFISRAYNATVKDLGIVNATIESNNRSGRIGVFAGFNRNSTFINCWSAGMLTLTCTDDGVTSPQLGGLFGSTNDTGICTNCWSTYKGALGNGGGKFTNCYGYENNPNIVDDAVNGALCYTLNNGSFIAPEWFQRIGEDNYPCQNEGRGIVYKTTTGYSTLLPEDGTSFTAFRDNTIAAELQFVEEAVAYQALLDEYKQQISDWEQAETFEAFLQKYSELNELRQSIYASIAAYEAYEATCEAAITYLAENEFSNETRTLLETYLNTEIEPNETYVHGTYPYIMDVHELDDQEIADETAYVEILLQKAISGGFVPGTDITVTISNYEFKDGLNGWTVESTNGGVTTGGEKGVMTLAQGQNTNFSAQQTLSDIPNGIYMFRTNAFTRTGGDNYSLLNVGQLYLNGNSNFVMTIAEDVIGKDEAEDGVNCHLTGDGADTEFTNEEMNGYVPASLVGTSYAFNGDRYVNYTAVEVTEGTLTLGVRNLGSGLGNDWLPFGGVRVFYLGTAEEANESLIGVLKNYQDRAENILGFAWSDGEDYARYPNMSEALKVELETTLSESKADLTGEQKMAFINKFSQLFNEVYNCRKAYVAVLKAADKLMDQADALQNLIDEDAFNEALDAAGNAWAAYSEGSMTTEEALAKVAMLEEISDNLKLMKKDDDGFYLIGNSTELMIFAALVNAGDLGANAKLTADIDMSNEENFTGIGVARNVLYSGTFDGQGHKISGMTISYPGKEDVGFFHIAKATLKNFWLDETCLIEGDKGVALVGWCNGDSPVLEGIGVAAQIKGSENTSSFIGRAWKNPQFKNCWSIGEIDNSVGSGNKTNTGVFMGWCNTWGGSFTNCWTTATFAIAPADANYLTRKGDNVIFNNCYSLYGSQATRMTEDDVISGALCYALNGDQSEITWYQTLGVDPYPVLDSSHRIVTKNDDGTYRNDDGTGIVAADDRRKMTDIYDLSGRRIGTVANTTLKKGIYIVNGRKVMIK